MTFADEIGLYLSARYTLLQVETLEEDRLAQGLAAVCQRRQRPLYGWDSAAGMRAYGNAPLPPDWGKVKDPLMALDTIAQHGGDAVFLLPDFHVYWREPRVVRTLRHLGSTLKTTRKTVVLTTPSALLPEELRDAVVSITMPLPNSGELEEILQALRSTPGLQNRLTPVGESRLVQAALGMTANQAQRAFSKAIIAEGGLSERAIDLVVQEKKAIVRESGALEFYAQTETIDQVGGLTALKGWLHSRSRAFSEEARRYGLPAPKGIALIGLPGTGKSLVAKMIAGLWHVPLLRLDVGALYGSLVGESEANTRKALHLAETIAPCLLWVDEMEKAFASGHGDSGTSLRVLGTLETWMQEHTRPVFVVATANDISSLPPELLRRGRFDEIFFLDLPTAEERAEILRVHLKKRGRPVPAFEEAMAALVAASDRFVGAEIEQSLIDAMYAAFSDPEEPEREVTPADLLAAMAEVRPLAVAQTEAIGMLRQWLQEGRVRPASEPRVLGPARPAGSPVALELPLDGSRF